MNWQFRSRRWAGASWGTLGYACIIGAMALAWLSSPWGTRQRSVAVPLRWMAASPPSMHGLLLGALIALLVSGLLIAGVLVVTYQLARHMPVPHFASGPFWAALPFIACWVPLVSLTGVGVAAGIPSAGYGLSLALGCIGMLCLFVSCLYRIHWRLSSERAGVLALDELADLPVVAWPDTSSFGALQAILADAALYGDEGTLAVLTERFAAICSCSQQGARAPASAGATSPYVVGDVLVTLLNGSLRTLSRAPLEASEMLGRVLGCVLLCAVAEERSGGETLCQLGRCVADVLTACPGKAHALWSGMRIMLFHTHDHEVPLVLRHWLAPWGWTADDPRRVLRVAEAVCWLHEACSMTLAQALAGDGPQLPIAVWMLADVYRDIARELGRAVQRERRSVPRLRLRDLPLELLDAVHTQALARWSSGEPAARLALVEAYELRRMELMALLYGAAYAARRAEALGVSA